MSEATHFSPVPRFTIISMRPQQMAWRELLPFGFQHVISPARVYSIVVTASREKAGTFVRSMIITLTGQPDKPFAVLKWNVARLEEANRSMSSQLMSCHADLAVQ
jgi:hypothetical protein